MKPHPTLVFFPTIRALLGDFGVKTARPIFHCRRRPGIYHWGFRGQNREAKYYWLSGQGFICDEIVRLQFFGFATLVPHRLGGHLLCTEMRCSILQNDRSMPLPHAPSSNQTAEGGCLKPHQ